MSDQFEKGRYLHLNGQEVSRYEAQSKVGQAWQAAVGYAKLPEVQINLAVSFGLAATGQLSLGMAVFNTVALMSFKQNVFRWTNKKVFSKGLGEDVNSLYFDTKPDRGTPPTNFRHLLIAEHMSKMGKEASLISPLTGTTLGLLIDPFLGISVAVAGTLPSAAMAYRYNKVVKGDWAITNEPPKQEVREAKEAPLPAFSA